VRRIYLCNVSCFWLNEYTHLDEQVLLVAVRPQPAAARGNPTLALHEPENHAVRRAARRPFGNVILAGLSGIKMIQMLRKRQLHDAYAASLSTTEQVESLVDPP
jgi:hypothetical protein